MFVSYIDSIQLVVYVKVEHSILKACMLQIFFAEYRFLNRYEPVNAKGFILDIYASICFGMIELITLVLEDGGFGENGEAVSKATRYEELTTDD